MDKCEHCDEEKQKAITPQAIIYRSEISKKWYLEIAVDETYDVIIIDIFHCPMCGRKLRGSEK